MLTITYPDGTSVTMTEEQFRAERGTPKARDVFLARPRPRRRVYVPRGNGVDARFTDRDRC